MSGLLHLNHILDYKQIIFRLENLKYDLFVINWKSHTFAEIFHNKKLLAEVFSLFSCLGTLEVVATQCDLFQYICNLSDYSKSFGNPAFNISIKFPI